MVADFREVRILFAGFRVGFALESSDCAFDWKQKLAIKRDKDGIRLSFYTFE